MGESPILQKAWTTFDLKSTNDELREIVGIASTPNEDLGGDELDPLGAKFALPMPLFWEHKRDQPVGQVLQADVAADGIRIRAKFARIEDAGRLKDRLDEAWQSVKVGLVRGLSIGWRPLEGTKKKSGGLKCKSWHWIETSAVTLPMNIDASILSIKSADAAHRAPTEPARASRALPGASGTSRASAMQPISEQIEIQQNDLLTKSARLEELEGQDERGELTDEDIKERDGLVDAIQAQSKKVQRLQAMETAQAISAKGIGVVAGNGGNGHSQPRYSTGSRVQVVTPDLPKGTLFARYAMAVAAGKGSYSDTLAYAKRWDNQTPEVSAYVKAIAGTSVVGSPAWGGELVVQQTLVSEFVELVRAATVLPKLVGIRDVPFNVAIQVQDSGSTVNWVGEEAVKPVTELAFSLLTLPYDKIAGIVVMTEELVRLSTPSAEAVVRRDLTEQIARFIDEQFLDPTITVSASRPASITNGIASPAASGDDADALYNDLNTALATFDAADLGTESVHIVTTPALARGISTMRNALGQPEFGAVTPQGGTLMGYPLIVSSSTPSGHVILIKANEILLADDGRVSLDASNQATLDMAGGSSPTFSLWQKNCIGIRAERWITWKRRTISAVAIIDSATYGPSAGSPG